MPLPDATALRAALDDPRRFLAFYGTTPPRADAPPERVERAAERLAVRVAGLGVDALVVYDVQDESGRTSEPRPFPFLPTLPSRDYASLLEERTGLPTVTYKCATALSEAEWCAYLDSVAPSAATDTRFLSLVGKATARAGRGDGISLLRACEIAAGYPHSPFTLGGVAIPERHAPPERSESRRLIDKAQAGCRYFISQAVYAPDAAIALLRDYAHDCAVLGLAPRRVILTFTPCGRPETMRFIKWLGIRIPPNVEEAILSSPTPLTESIRVCTDALRRIVESGVGEQVPLGINVESVSIKKEEIAASVDLLAALRECP